MPRKEYVPGEPVYIIAMPMESKARRNLPRATARPCDFCGMACSCSLESQKMLEVKIAQGFACIMCGMICQEFERVRGRMPSEQERKNLTAQLPVFDKYDDVEITRVATKLRALLEA